MNPSAPTQLIGNICVGLAAFIYALPLQLLLLEISRKRDDGGGVLAGIILLVPMWLLLLTALCFVTASGGFDGLHLARGWLYAFVIGATLSMLALSFATLEFSHHPNFFTRLISRVPVYPFPLATLLLVVLHLNPRLAPVIPIPPVKLIWLICAGLSLALCGGFLGYRFAVAGKGRVLSLTGRIAPSSPSDGEIIAKIAMLDPQRDFAKLLGRTNQKQSRAVRETATARLRTHPDFLETLAANLTSRDSERGLEFLLSATLSPAEQNRLAWPARTAIERFTNEIPAPNYMSSDRRKQLLSWGREMFPSIAEKFSATGVDFSEVMPAFEHALRLDDSRRR